MTISSTIAGSVFPVCKILLPQGKKIYANAGSMVAMSGPVSMKLTGQSQGVMGGLKRILSGSSLMFVEFVSSGDAEVVVGGGLPGTILQFSLAEGESLICQRDAFLWAEETVTYDMIVPGIKAGLFGGEGLFLQKLTGPGMVALSFDGELLERTLADDETLAVSSNHAAAWQPSVEYTARILSGGLGNIIFSGEGLFISGFRGPGKVWLQTLPVEKMGRSLSPYISRRGAIGVGVSGSNNDTSGGSSSGSN